MAVQAVRVGAPGGVVSAFPCGSLPFGFGGAWCGDLLDVAIFDVAVLGGLGESGSRIDFGITNGDRSVLVHEVNVGEGGIGVRPEDGFFFVCMALG